jgi:hypothetical protein
MEPKGGSGDSNTQEMTKGTKICHGEFRVEFGDDLREKVRGGGGENDIIYIKK